MKLTINSYYHFLLFIIISTIFLTSCETNNIIIKPDLTSNVFSNNELIRTGVKIVRVYDKRLGRQVLLPEDVGWVHDGVNDKEFPVLFDDYVLTFVENSINKMICADTSATDFVPVIVTIDTFKVYETLNQPGKTSTFKASMNFEFPLSNDSTLIISTNTIQKIKTDSGVTVLIENLIYAGIRECSERFIQYFDKSLKFKEKAEYIAQKYNIDYLPGDMNDGFYRKFYPVKKTDEFINFSYYSGFKINFGYDINYMYYKYFKYAQLRHGFGIGICNFNFTKKIDKFYKYVGDYYEFQAKYNPRYYFNETGKGFYLDAGLTLSIGSERITDPQKSMDENDNSNIYIGPIITESVGYRLKGVTFSISSYQFEYFGTKGLPSDNGLLFNLGLEL